jgi:hypothetical protein
MDRAMKRADRRRSMFSSGTEQLARSGCGPECLWPLVLPAHARRAGNVVAHGAAGFFLQQEGCVGAQAAFCRAAADRARAPDWRVAP